MEKQEVYATLNRAYFGEDCHERELLENLPRLLVDAEFVVDVGASLGQYTRAASRAMRRGRVLAIEADGLRHEELARNATRWAAESGLVIDALHAAVSETPGEATFYTTHSNVSGGLFPRDGDTALAWQTVRVPAVTLDQVCGERVPDFVKADVEGAELRMLKGATRILAARRTLFLLEIHPWDDPALADAESVPAFMRRHGYLGVSFYDHTLFLPYGLHYLREKAAAGWRKLRRQF
ncbi:MAG: FkbM family methyltransferase [Gammaproteobacteria bacterium]|nr:FkbM family methyltransferase [Gammaproteobacteria bacterium]